MNILITGASGFLGKNLLASLESIRDGKDKSFALKADLVLMPYDIDTPPALLDTYCQKADFVCHLAGVNRPKDPSEFMVGNLDFSTTLLHTLQRHHSKAPILLSSSIQAGLNNPYGESKKAAEDLVFAYGRAQNIATYVYRLPNIFGKWCRPNYNSVIATFCHNITHDLPIFVNDPHTMMQFVYVDDVVKEIIHAIAGNPNRQGDFCAVVPSYDVPLGKAADLLHSFKQGRDDLSCPDMGDPFTAKLYATYLSYLPADSFRYPLRMNVDDRGSFTEILRTPDRGQFSVNVSRPGITKGNHWHHTKNEKFVVVSGKGVIRFRKLGEEKVIEYFVSGETIEVVDIPPGYTHNIENLGDSDLVTFMWASECFNPDKPDTYFLEV